MGVRKAWVGVGMDGVRDRVGDREGEEEGVRDRVYGMVQGVWLRAGLGVGRDLGTGGLWYGCMVWGKRVGQGGQGLGWGTVG